MKVIKTKEYKLAYTSYDDQPNFIGRDTKNQGTTILTDPLPCSEDEIKDRWGRLEKGKKRRRKPGLSIDTMPQGSI